MHKITAALITAIMLLPLLAACGTGDRGGAPTLAVANAGEPPVAPTLTAVATATPTAVDTATSTATTTATSIPPTGTPTPTLTSTASPTATLTPTPTRTPWGYCPTCDVQFTWTNRGLGPWNCEISYTFNGPEEGKEQMLYWTTAKPGETVTLYLPHGKYRVDYFWSKCDKKYASGQNGMGSITFKPGAYQCEYLWECVK